MLCGTHPFAFPTLASSFFEKYIAGGDVSHAGKLITSIAVQLASSVPMLYRNIRNTIMEYSDIASRSLYDQWRLLVLDPPSKLNGNNYRTPYILVIDALEECDSNKNIMTILQLLAEARSLARVQLRVFLTSRPEIPIRYGFNQIPTTEHWDFVLHNISQSIIDHDISVFLEHNLEIIRRECYLDTDWPGDKNPKFWFRTHVGCLSGLTRFSAISTLY